MTANGDLEGQKLNQQIGEGQTESKELHGKSKKRKTLDDVLGTGGLIVLAILTSPFASEMNGIIDELVGPLGASVARMISPIGMAMGLTAVWRLVKHRSQYAPRQKLLLWGAVILYMILLALFSSTASKNPNDQLAVSRSQTIMDVVDALKQSTTLPAQIDEVTTMTDVIGLENAIRYELTLRNIDEKNVTRQSLKNMMLPSLCSQDSTRSLLDSGIEFEYSYTIEPSGKNLLVEVGSRDCVY